METKRFSAKITPDAATALRRKAQDDVCPQEPVFSQCAQDVQDRLDAILKDGRIDTFEAPGLFSATVTASPDQRFVATDFADDTASRTNALKTLGASEFILKATLGMATSLRNEMRDDETSYFNFVSLENLWGMSPYLLGKPASALRLDATIKLISELQDHQIGIEILRAGITNGYFPEDNQFVQKFLSGPFKTLFNADGPVDGIPVIQGLVNLANRFECDEIAALLPRLFEPLIGENAKNDMLPDRSVDFWEMHGRQFTNAAVSLPQMLALASGQLLGEVVFKSVLARSTAVGILARLGMGRLMLPGYAIFEGTTGFGWRLPPLLKGVMNLCIEIAKFNMYYMVASGLGGRTGGNIVGALYMGAVGLTAGYANQWMRGLLSQLRSGQPNGALAWHLLEDPIGPLAQTNLSRNLAQVDAPKTFQLASDTAARKIFGEISALRLQLEEAQLQLAREAAERAVVAQREAARQALEARAAAAREKTLVQRAAKQADRVEKLRERLGVRVAEAKAVAAQLPDDLQGTFLEGVQQAAGNPDLNAVLTNLRILMDDARETIRAASRPIPRSRSTPQSRPIEARKGLVPRDVRMAEHRPTPAEVEGDVEVELPITTAEPTPTPLPVVAETSMADIERLIKHPPRELDMDTLTSITMERVVFDKSMMKEIQETYRTTPSIRGRLIRRLAELSGRIGDLTNKNWTVMMDKNAPACIRGKVGDQYRIMAQRMPDGRWNVYNLEVRGQLKPNSGDWFPK